MDGGTTFSVTYAELATKLGITVPSAKNLVRRKRWDRAPGNDGATRISIPKDYLDEHAPAANAHDAGTDAATNASTGTATDSSTDALIDAGIRLAAFQVLERQIARLEAEVEALKGERDALASMPVQVAALKATLDAVTSERDRLLTAEHLRASRSWWRRLAG
jgi:hypothetical protein